MKTAWRK